MMEVSDCFFFLSGSCGRLKGAVGGFGHCGTLLGALWGAGESAASYGALGWEAEGHFGRLAGTVGTEGS